MIVPHYCPLISNRMSNPMHEHVTPDKCYATGGQFADATLDFLRSKVPKNWNPYRDNVSDNFRDISRRDFRVLA
jgi:hypothetical protein